MQPYHQLVQEYTRSSAPIANLIPAKLRTAYGLNTIASEGEGQIIAIITAFTYPTAVIQTNLDKFCAKFNIPSTIVVSKIMTNSRGRYPLPNSDWRLEISLDVQWAHVIAPKATIMIVQAHSTSFIDMGAAVDYAINNGANIVSMSWGTNEFNAQVLYDHRFKPKNNKGENVTYIASSGNEGAIVSWPSSSNNVISVGGTSLDIDIHGNRTNEVGWDGSGGGISMIEPMQSYQRGYGLGGSKRQVPDVGFVADPYTGVPVYDSGRWYQVGGTSLGAPCYAGMIAIANQIRKTMNKEYLTTNSILTYLYSTKASGKYAMDFFDVIGGSGRIGTKIGYDNVAGLGSPKNTVSSGIIYDLSRM